jgi:hypothetical protein
LKATIRQIDSSLLDEWEKLSQTHPVTARSDAAINQAMRTGDADVNDVTRDSKTFIRLIRNEAFTFLRSLAMGDDVAAASQFAPFLRETDHRWTAPELETLMNQYHQDHHHISLEPEARNSRHTYVKTDPTKKSWQVQQVIVDPEGANDWIVEFEVDLVRSREMEQPVMTLIKIAPLADLGAEPMPTPSPTVTE